MIATESRCRGLVEPFEPAGSCERAAPEAGAARRAVLISAVRRRIIDAGGVCAAAGRWSVRLPIPEGIAE